MEAKNNVNSVCVRGTYVGKPLTIAALSCMIK